MLLNTDTVIIGLNTATVPECLPCVLISEGDKCLIMDFPSDVVHDESGKKFTLFFYFWWNNQYFIKCSVVWYVHIQLIEPIKREKNVGCFEAAFKGCVSVSGY